MPADRDPTPCLICGRRLMNLGSHLVRAHNMASSEYRSRFPDAPGTDPMTAMELKLPVWLFKAAGVFADGVTGRKPQARAEYVRHAVAWRVRQDMERLRESNPDRYATIRGTLDAHADSIREQDPAVFDLLTRDLNSDQPQGS